SQDRFTKAASSYENALKLQRKLGDQTGEAKSLLSLGDVYYNLGKFDNALSWYQDAHKIYNQIQDKLGQTESLRKIGGIHLTMNKFEAALDYYKKALQLATTIKDPENIWKSNYGLGLVLKRQGMKEAAVKYFRDAIEAIETIKGKRSFFQTEKEFIKNELDVYLETIETLLELHVKHPHLEYHQSAFEYLERMIARKLQNIFFSIETRHYDPIVQEQLTTFRSNVLQEGNLSKLLVDEKALPEAKQDQKKIANLNQYLSRIRDNLRSDQTKLRKSCPRLETLLSVRPVPVRRIQDHLSKEQALIEYLPLENQLYIFLISQTNFSVKQVTLKKEELWKQVKSFREEMDRTRQKWQEKGAIPEVRSWNELRFSSLKTTLTRMYDYLIKPLEADLHNYQNLIIIPTGLLSYFPFQALAQETKKGKLTFLIQDKDIQYWTYANRLTFKAKDPSFKNPQVLMLTENSQSIAKEVGEIFKRTTSYWGSEATEAKLKQPSGAFQILHLAVPGFLDHKYPEESFLQLAPEESSGNDGKLGLSEILEIPLMDASLVVLPAVETTVTEESSGIELTYFVETLGMAGADRVVLTQWPGPAFGTEEVIKKFYKALKNSRPEEALRKTQVSLLRNHQLAHPVCWAPFVLYEY
ncbi:MAG: CHAT domain-containing protein, partial [candidate division KSB1 bacterium]|nr:CHAT domain-containing protein [candidate division KSB1 bacterium]